MGLDAEICGLARALKSDVDACLDCDVGLVHVFIPTSDIQRVHMDATRTEPAYLLEVCRAAAAAGATIINLPDTVGIASPSMMAMMVSGIAKEVDVMLDVHCHNDFGLAVANTTTAVDVRKKDWDSD